MRKPAESVSSPAVVPVNEKINGLEIRRIIIEQSKRAGVGHIGSALSVADIIACLYGRVLRISYPRDPERDRFILSKGHAALALYAAFHLKGWLDKEELDTFCGEGSALGVHPEYALLPVDFATGSLGQGLSFGAGAALAAKKLNSSRRVFVLLSDAELNEGAVWEAVMFSAHHKLSNLIAIIDLNGQQAFGYTKDVLDLQPVENRWQAFGWDVHVADGHDAQALADLINRIDTTDGAPHVIVARTIFGKGISFMENKIHWHYSPLADAEFEQAMNELEDHNERSVR